MMTYDMPSGIWQTAATPAAESRSSHPRGRPQPILDMQLIPFAIDEPERDFRAVIAQQLLAQRPE